MLSTPPSLGPAGGAGGPAAPGSPLKHRIARSVSWLAWSHGVVQVVSFIVTLVVARWLDPTDYAGHSLRAGFATSAAAAGVEEREIARQTGHQSMAVLRRYIREGELFRRNPAAAP